MQAVTENYRFQCRTVFKCCKAKLFHAVTDGNTRNSRTVCKGEVGDLGDVIRKREMSVKACSEHISFQNVYGIAEYIGGFARDHVGERVGGGGVLKSEDADRYHTVWERDEFNRGKIGERTNTESGDPVRNRDVLEFFGNVNAVCLVAASAEDVPKPGMLGVLKATADKGKCDLFNIVTVLKRADADHQIPRVGVGNRDRGEPRTEKSVLANVGQRVGRCEFSRKSRIRHCVAVDSLERTVLARGNGVQLCTTVKCEIGDLYDLVGQSDIRQFSATVKRALIDTVQSATVREGDAFQRGAVCKRVIINGDHTGGNMDRGDVLCRIEGAVTKGEDIGVFKEIDLGECSLLKRTEAEYLNASGDREASRSSRRDGDQLSAVGADQQAVSSRIVRIVCINAKGGQVGERYESVFSNISHVRGNLKCF